MHRAGSYDFNKNSFVPNAVTLEKLEQSNKRIEKGKGEVSCGLLD